MTRMVEIFVSCHRTSHNSNRQKMMGNFPSLVQKRRKIEVVDLFIRSVSSSRYL